MTEAVVLNEALGVSSSRVAERVFNAIDRERQTARDPAARSGLTGWFAELFSPRVLAFAAGAAVLLIAVEAGVIARLALQEHAPLGGGYLTQSIPPDAHTTRRPDPGAFVRVSFSPQASMAEVANFLSERDAMIVEGPTAGLYRVRIGRNYVAKEELDRLVKEFQSASNIVASVMPD